MGLTFTETSYGLLGGGRGMGGGGGGYLRTARPKRSDPGQLRSCVKVEVDVLVDVPNTPYGFCGRKATLNCQSIGAQDLCESRGGRPY